MSTRLYTLHHLHKSLVHVQGIEGIGCNHYICTNKHEFTKCSHLNFIVELVLNSPSLIPSFDTFKTTDMSSVSLSLSVRGRYREQDVSLPLTLSLVQFLFSPLVLAQALRRMSVLLGSVYSTVTLVIGASTSPSLVVPVRG